MAAAVYYALNTPLKTLPRNLKPMESPMKNLPLILATAAVLAAISPAAFAQGTALNPKGTFADSWGTTFSFSLCGSGGDLCGTLVVLKGNSATAANLAFVGKQIVAAKPQGVNTWKGSINAGGMSADATVTQTGANTINIQGYRAVILCQTITYTRQ